MIESSIARRYARALIELAREVGRGEHPPPSAFHLRSSSYGGQADGLWRTGTGSPLQDYDAQLHGFYALAGENPMLLDTLTNRFFDLAARLRIVDRLAQKLNLSPSVKNFIKLLIKKGRIGLFGEIVAAYRREMHLLQNKGVATVVSARGLSPAVYDEIGRILSRKTGKEVVVEREVKPEVLGGVCVQLGGEVYDGTVKAALDCLSERMLEA